LSRLWYFIFPLMYLPNMGLGFKTTLGRVDIGDLVIGPLLLMMMLAPGGKYRKAIHQAFPVILAFIVWALISTLSIPLRFDQEPLLALFMGLEKLAKFTLYAGVGTLAASRLNTANDRRMWLWSLLAAAGVLCVGVLRGAAAAASTTHAGMYMNTEAYKAYNEIVVAVGLLFVYLAGMLLDGNGTKAWRRCALLTSGLLLFAIAGSASGQLHGRSGWFGLFFGLLYIFYRHGLRLRVLLVISLLVVGTTVAYHQIHGFEYLVNETFFAERNANNEIGFDDSGRASTAVHELPKIVDHPVLGTGLFHRGGSSGLWLTGPHNFLIAMLLETGVIGLVLIIAIIVRFWLAVGRPATRFFRLDISSRAVLVAAFVASNAGEYFYGGTALLTFTSLLALATSLPAEVAFAAKVIDDGAVPEQAPAQ
jgi:O-antigen ligase